MDVPEDRLELQRLQALEDSGLLTLPAPPELEAICREVQAHFRTAVAMVTLLTKDGLIAKVRVGTDLEEVARLGQFWDLTIRSDRVFVVPDAAQDPALPPTGS